MARVYPGRAASRNLCAHGVACGELLRGVRPGVVFFRAVHERELLGKREAYAVVGRERRARHEREEMSR
jgi:hypothetical protein